MTVAEDTISALQEAAAAYHGKIDDINDQLDAKKQEMDDAISALGARLVWAGGPSGHQLGAGLAILDMSISHIMPNPEYVAVSGGDITIKKSGLYMLHGFVMQHSNSGQRYLVIDVNGESYQFSHSGAVGGWSTGYPSFVGSLEEDDVIHVKGEVTGTNLYRAHYHSRHTRIHLLYLGDLA